MIQDLKKLYKGSLKEIESFYVLLNSLVKPNSELTAQITILNASIVELTRRLNQDSTNSGKPSSSDPYRKSSSKMNNSREKTSSKVGGQANHKGSNLPKFENEMRSSRSILLLVQNVE